MKDGESGSHAHTCGLKDDGISDTNDDMAEAERSEQLDAQNNLPKDL